MSSASPGTELIISTGSNGWLASVAKAYRAHMSFVLLDEAHLGIDPLRDTLLDMGRKANLGYRDWMAVLVGLGISSVGAFLLVMAVLDPEPYSKITFALGTGALLVAGGGFATIRVLVGHQPPHVKVSPDGGFEIRFD